MAQQAYVRVLSIDQGGTGSTTNTYHLAVDWSGDSLTSADAVTAELSTTLTPLAINSAIVDAVVARALNVWGVTVDPTDVFLNPTRSPLGCMASRTATQSISPSVWTAVAFTATDISDSYGFHDPAVNPSQLIVPAGWTGTYLLIGHSGLNASGTAYTLGWGINGASPTEDASAGYPVNAVNAEVVYIKELVAGDYVELMLWHTSASSKNTPAANTGAIYYLGEVA